jgi:hypothetical protein
MSFNMGQFSRVLILAFGIALIAPTSFGEDCRVTTTVRLLDEHALSRSITPEELTAQIGGSPAKIISVERGTPPVTILLIDASSSMKQTWGQSVAAAKQFLASSGDRVAVVVFREQILDHASGSAATSKLLDHLATEKIGYSTGGTALYDSLIAVAGAAKNPDAALVVISDGEDNASRNSSEQTVNWFLKNHWPPVFGLVLDYDHDQTHRGYFKKIVNGTGGLVAYPSSASKVAEATGELSSLINAPLTIILQPSQLVMKPEKLKLEAIGSDGKPRQGLEIAHPAEITACDRTPLSSPKSK